MHHLLQITDTHLYADTSRGLKGINTQASFQAVLSRAMETVPNADLLLLTGDLAHDESAEAYKRLKLNIDAVGTPYRAIPGNHDNPQFLYDTLGPANSVELGNWRVILLNSHLDGAVGGALDKEEWQRLEAELEAASGKHLLVCVHHHPLAIGSSWMDEIGLDQGHRFLDLLSKRPKTSVVLNGHIHQEFHAKYAGVHIFGSPSTNIQFQANDNTPGYATMEPGFRRLTLHDNGEFETEVLRVEGFASQIDQDVAY